MIIKIIIFLTLLYPPLTSREEDYPLPLLKGATTLFPPFYKGRVREGFLPSMKKALFTKTIDEENYSTEIHACV